MASNKRGAKGSALAPSKKAKTGADGDEEPSAFEMELAMFEDDMDMEMEDNDTQSATGKMGKQMLTQNLSAIANLNVTQWFIELDLFIHV